MPNEYTGKTDVGPEVPEPTARKEIFPPLKLRRNSSPDFYSKKRLMASMSQDGAGLTACVSIAAGQPFDEQGGNMARRRFQKGRLFLRGVRTPQWVGRWREDTITPDGSVTRVEKSVVLGTKAELPTRRLAARRLELILSRINAPGYRPVRVATLAAFAERWRLEVLAQRKPSTRRAAESHLKVHILPELGGMKLDQIGRENQQIFATHLSRKVSRKTVLNVLGTLSSILSKAKEWGYICEGVEFGKLVLPEASIGFTARFFSADQARQIIEAAPEPFSTMFGVLAMTGIRAGELLGLQVDDLDFDRRLIFIRRSAWYGRIQTLKSKASQGTLPMPQPLAAMLMSYLATWKPNPGRLLFANQIGRPMSANKVVQRKLWPILDALKIPRCGLHAFRHTHSSLLVEGGAPVSVAQAQLRHADPKITLGIYSHVLGDSQRKAVEKVAAILRPNAPKLKPDGEWIQ
jgi:integrase